MAAAFTNSPLARAWLFSLALLTLGAVGAQARAERVKVYTNINFAPLVIDEKRGLYPETVGYLNRLKLDGLEFVLAYLPRKRLQVALEEGWLDGIVIGMAPQWVRDPQQQKYLWTEPFASDGFVLVSGERKPYLFGQPSDAPGARIGVTLGYVYPGVDDWIARNHFYRDEASTEARNIDKFMRGRVDLIVVSESVFRHYARSNQIGFGILVEALPGKPNERRFLVPKSKRQLYERLAPAIRRLNEDPQWRQLTEKF